MSRAISSAVVNGLFYFAILLDNANLLLLHSFVKMMFSQSKFDDASNFLRLVAFCISYFDKFCPKLQYFVTQ